VENARAAKLNSKRVSVDCPYHTCKLFDDVKSGMMVDRMAEIVWSDAASGTSPKASWHMTYVTPVSTTCVLSVFRTVEGDPTRQNPSSNACSNEFGRFGGEGKLPMRERKVNVSNQRA
jgi:hypothetical protein